MKRGAITHHKTAHLASILGIERWGAVGIMESLYHATAERTPRGDIGRLTNREIAYYIGWNQDDADRLVAALIEARLIDETDDDHRLVVHDWAEHCDDATKKKVARANETFATASQGRSVRTTADNGGQRRTTADNGGQRRTCPPKSACLSQSQSQSLARAGALPHAPRALSGSPAWQDDIDWSLAPQVDTRDFREAMNAFLGMREERRHDYGPPPQGTQLAALVGRCAIWGHDRAIAALRHTTANGWKNVREPDAAATKGKHKSALEMLE